MEYTNEVIKGVEENFSSEHPIHEAMGKGHDILKYLEDGARLNPLDADPADVMTAIEAGDIESNVYRKATKAAAIGEVLAKYREEF